MSTRIAKKNSRRADRQLQFEIKTRGGRRAGAGRKKVRIGEGNHVAREEVTARTPVHVTLKLQKGLPSLRHRDYLSKFADAVRAAREFGLRVQHFSIETNHIHFVAEADDHAQFTSGLRSLTIRFSKSVRAVLRDKAVEIRGAAKLGSLFVGRYHARVLKTPTDVRNVLRYVLQNTAHHLGRRHRDVAAKALVLDPFSSLHALKNPELLFGSAARTKVARDYFAEVPWLHSKIEDFLSPSRSWLLSVGWQRTRGNH